MDPLAFVVGKIKGLAVSGQDFVDGFFHRRQNSTRQNPIEILKRLQREAFSDLMRLRDRQDNVERMLSFYKTSKGSPFAEANTHLRGEVDVLGAILLLGDVDLQHQDTLDRAGIKTGIESRFIFETTIREKDALLAEFVASQNNMRYDSDVSRNALSLAKVSYIANICDWFSLTVIPVGAQFRDLSSATNSSNQRKGLTDLSSVGSPLLNQHNGSTVGLTVRKSNVVASLAQSVSGLGLQPCSPYGVGHCFSTFGQIVCQLPRRIKLSLSGVHLVPKSSSHRVDLGALTIPLVFRKQCEFHEPVIEVSPNPLQTLPSSSIGLNLETELDENTKIGGWIEMKNSNSKQLQWAVNVFDDSEDECGWGMCVSGMVEGSSNRAHLQAESYLKLNLGKKLSLKPGIAYAVDGNVSMFALMLRSSWCF